LDVLKNLYTKNGKFLFKKLWLCIIDDYDVVSEYNFKIQELFQGIDLENLQNKKDLESKLTILKRVGKFLKEMLQYKGAENVIKRALEISMKIYGDRDVRTAKISFALAQTYWNQGRERECVCVFGLFAGELSCVCVKKKIRNLFYSCSIFF